MTRVSKQTSREGAGGKTVLLVLGVLLVLAGGGYAAAYYAAGDKVPRGASVAGVEIGDQSPQEARKTLRRGLADRVGAPIAVSVDGQDASVSPAEAGLEVDYAASVAAAGGGRSWSPGRLWDYWTGGGDSDAVVEVDDEAFDAALDALADEVGTPPVEGAIDFKAGQIQVTDPEPGEGFDREDARESVLAAYLTDEAAELDSTIVEPEIGAEQVQAALDSFANPAMSGPVTLVFGKSPVQLSPQEFSPVLSMRAEDGELVPDLAEKRLAKLVDSRVSDKDEPVDATVRLVNGKPKVIPAKPGVTYEPADISEVFLELVTRTDGEREMEVEATVAEPEFTTADAKALGIKRKVSSFTTYYPYAEYRNINIGRAAEIIDGTILKPGETFSLNDTVGERTRENGFTEGFIISNGIFKSDLGGGVSQMATTLFNAMFFAGLEDVEHKPHSFYIDRYPVGREATVAWGAIDLRFRNDTDYGVLIQTTVQPATPSSQGVVTATFYSTKVWDITTKTSERYNYRAPQTRTLTTPDCYPNTGYSGFDVDVWRYFHKPGSDEVERTEKFHTAYTASDTVVCKKPGSGNGGDND